MNNVVSKAKTSPATSYENNPFFIATNGLDLLLKKARSVAILLAILSVLSVLSRLFSDGSSYQTTDTTKNITENQAATQSFIDNVQNLPQEMWVLTGLLVLVIIFTTFAIGVIFRGVVDYTASQIASGKTVTISEAFRAVFRNFWGYAWVLVIMAVKTILWTLLFIVPGIIMSIRYSLAGVAYFDKGLKGNEAVKHSMTLTKGAWLTTFASTVLPNILTFSMISLLLQSGTNAILYRQYSTIGDTKPKAHYLSWITLIVSAFLMIMLVLLIAAVLILAASV